METDILSKAQDEAENAVSDETPPPRIWFETIQFSDGTEIELEKDDIVVFVGPNNAGKSAALRELEAWLGRSAGGVVVASAKLKKTGNAQTLRKYLEENAHKQFNAPHFQYSGIGYNIHETHLGHFDNEQDRHPVASFFAKRLATETRIQDSDPAPGIALYQAPPTHPIHLLLMDETLADDVSKNFRQAFGVDLTAFRAGGNSFPLYIGEKPPVPVGKDELSKEFVESLLASNTNLKNQGDGMRSFAAVMLHALAADTHSVQFLDEPEAFLHPPQARLLGKYIAKERKSASQLFIATHSADILHGLIEGGAEKVRIIRLRREGNKNHVKELSKENTKEISKDTLTRYSGVFHGIFFQHVVICESDADCMFYQSILNIPAISSARRPDVLFVHSSGKHRMQKLAGAMKALDVPVSVIADIDLLNDGETFKKLATTLGIDWEAVEGCWIALNKVILSKRPPLNAAQVVGLVAEAIDGVAGTGAFPKENEKKIKNVFDTVSPWSYVKKSGVAAIPSGEPTLSFNKLKKTCAEAGLWIVPVGEIEGFCRSVGSHGPGFVEHVLENRDLETDHELEGARQFVGEIWKRIEKT